MLPIPPDQEHEAKSTNIGRRSFLIKGAVAAPILAAFVNKPLWAASDNCISSGSMSGNLSNHHCAAIARSAQWWAQASSSLWPHDVYYNGMALVPGTSFTELFQNPPLRLTAGTYHEVKANGQPKLDPSGQPILKTFDRSTRRRSLHFILTNGARVDNEFVAAFLNISHPGIAYDGFADIAILVASYQQAIDSYLLGVLDGINQLMLNAIFDDLATGLAQFNIDNDRT